MKIILRTDIENIGSRGDIIKVKSGHARNYLIPMGYAYLATKGNQARFRQEKLVGEAKEAKELTGLQEFAKKLSKATITAQVKVGEEEKVFGSVTSITIHDLLSEQGFVIDKKNILLDEPIKALGSYKISIKLHPKVETKIKLWVVKEAK